MLRRLLERAGRDTGVLVNDFGALGIDAALLPPEPLVIALAEGCVCCQLQDDLLGGLLALLEFPLQRIIIEPSGLADPAGIIETLVLPDLTARVQLEAVIAVADAVHWDQWAALDPDLLHAQLAFAGTVLLNKWDVALPVQRTAVAKAARLLASSARIAPSVQGALPVNWQPGAASISAAPAPAGLQSTVHAVTISWSAPAVREAIAVWLAALPEPVWRIKGFVPAVEPGRWWLIQGVHGDRRVYPWPGPVAVPPGLVCIGPSVGRLNLTAPGSIAPQDAVSAGP